MGDPTSAEPEKSSPDPLRPISGVVRWTGPVALAGIVLIGVCILIAFFAPHPAWFLLFPVLVVAAVGGLATTVAWLLRHF